MKRLKFESLNKGLFQTMDVEKMKRIKGGYTANTVTCYSSGGCNDDGRDDCGSCD